MLTATKQWFTLPVLISCYCFVCAQANSGSVYYFIYGNSEYIFPNVKKVENPRST